MLIDITLEVTPQLSDSAPGSHQKSLAGHVGTHFDVMDKEFPLDYTCLPGIVFDVAALRDREIGVDDVDMAQVQPGMFVAFHTGFLAEVGYGGRTYFGAHPQLSQELIDALLEKGVCIIGVDCAGVRRGKEHVPADQRCADRGAFVIENLCELKAVLEKGGRFTAHTYPMRWTGMTGLPCRVIAEV